ncbi:MAG TPA: hypothetical protein VLC94_10850 [Candidatus Acidoferrum sp.]|nr:hypothetical protein [Candidatus Acidoferrum sp.]
MSEQSHPPLFPGDLPPAETVSGLARFRESTTDSLFQMSRAFPKLLALRSTPSAWTVFRVLLGAAGAGLVVLPLSLWNAWAFAPVGLALFLLAVLLPPIRQDRGTAKAVQQLGAYLVLDGGNIAVNAGEPVDVNFYLTDSRVWALDGDLRPVVVIPAGEISMVTAFPAQQDWTLRVSWQSGSAEFAFTGLFAERRARLAENGLQHLIHPAEPPRARTMAAGA